MGFSISSNRTQSKVCYDLSLLIVRLHRIQRIPGGEPTQTANRVFLLHILRHIDTNECLVAKHRFQSTVFAISVLPTPQVHGIRMNRLDVLDLFQLLRARRIERATAETASSCPQ